MIKFNFLKCLIQAIKIIVSIARIIFERFKTPYNIDGYFDGVVQDLVRVSQYKRSKVNIIKELKYLSYLNIYIVIFKSV